MRERVSPDVPTVFGSLGLESTANEDQRRIALAKWLTDPANPLTARVIVNRLWQNYFGRGIVSTPSDFGLLGQEPTHPELLDWLAGELIRQKWGLKGIHRLIVTSATYRQASSVSDAESGTVRFPDPENRLYWHAPIRRRDGESLRDVALQTAGVLNLRMEGPSSKPELPRALAQNRYAWVPDADPVEHRRRSIYLFNRRNFIYPLFRAFDAPSRNEACAARITTVTAQQSLELLNGDFLLEQARHTAGDVLRSARNDDAIVSACYRRVLGREPTAEEVELVEAFLTAQAETAAADGPPAPGTLPLPIPATIAPAEGAAVVDLIHALMNSAEFLYVD